MDALGQYDFRFADRRRNIKNGFNSGIYFTFNLHINERIISINSVYTVRIHLHDADIDFIKSNILKTIYLYYCTKLDNYIF